MLIAGCSILKKLRPITNTEDVLACKVEEKPVVFDTSSFSTFQSTYSDFLSSEGEFDIFHYYLIGNKEKVERAFLTDQKNWILQSKTKKGELKQDIIIDQKANRLSELVESVKEGHYWQKCRPDASSPYYHVYISKRNGKEIFAYFIESGEFEDINFEEIENLRRMIEVLKYLKNLYSN